MNENRLGIYILSGVILLVLLIFSLLKSNTFQERIPYSQFIQYVEEGKITSVKIVDENTLKGVLLQNDLLSGNIPRMVTSSIPYLDFSLTDRLLQAGITFEGSSSSMSIGKILLQLIPWVFILLIFFSLMRSINGGNRAFSFGKNRAQKYEKNDKTNITFDDVAGQIEAKYELQEIVEFLKNSERFRKIGARTPKGVLLIGNPGTGKTMLAKAVAGEAQVSFFHISGSDFVEMFVGVGASRVRDLFAEGRKNAPCIIFIDEIDAVGRTRGAGLGGGHDEREQTLNQLLVEMDGFGSDEGIIIMAATNRVDVLDPALLRPGRFDRQINIALPDLNERQKILEIHGQKIQAEKEIDYEALARRTPGCSGADLANIVNEAALYAARHNRGKVAMQDFEEARDKVLMGLARHSLFMTEKEKRLTAYHEAGHTLVSLFTKAQIFEKVTIVPRGQALGVTLATHEESYAPSRSVLVDRIKVCFGGYAAEELIFGETTVGTANDLKQATELAHRMVTEWGMSELGPIMLSQEQPVFLGREMGRVKDISEATARKVDEAVQGILSTCLREVEDLLRDNEERLHILAEKLLQVETLYLSEIKELLKLEEEPADPIK